MSKTNLTKSKMAEYSINIAVKFICKHIRITRYFMRIKCYGKLLQEIKTYEKYNGKYTKSTAEKFLKDYKETLSSDEMEDLSLKVRIWKC